VTPHRRLIVNADDFGQSAGINAGVIRAHRHGIVTSASLMVRWPAAVEAATYAAGNPHLSLGLHVDLGEWAYQAGSWIALYQVVRSDGIEETRREILGQLARFRSLTRRDPTHLDSHQHVHRSEPARSILLRLAAEIGVPLRHFAPAVTYCGDFYGQSGKGVRFPDAIAPEALAGIIRSLPEGTTELGCHPGIGPPADSTYSVERHREVESLCHPLVAAALREGTVDLCSFHDVRRDDARDRRD
jgi:chitin disaccharide deacetylase